MKLGDRYYSLFELIRNFIILIGLIIISIYLTGFKPGCTAPIIAKCIDIEYTYVADTDHFGRIMDNSPDNAVAHGIYQYEYDNIIYEWTDYTPFEAKAIIGNEQTILINPNNPIKATIINIPVIFVSCQFILLIGYGCFWCILSNIKYKNNN